MLSKIINYYNFFFLLYKNWQFKKDHLLLVAHMKHCLAVVFSHITLNYSKCKCLLYQINISSFNMIRPSSSVSPLQGSSLITDSSLLRDVMICLWPKSIIQMHCSFTRCGRLSYEVQKNTSEACNIYCNIHRGASKDTTVANSTYAFTITLSHF